MRTRTASLLLAALALAGCAGADGDGGAPAGPGDPTTGSLRGLVVDDAITPVPGAKVTLTGGPDAGATQETGVDGLFTFQDLAPGDYFVSVGKAGYTGGQVSASVVAGTAEPELVKVLLTRIATAQPYVDHFKLEGYYECAFSGEVGITDSCDFAYRTAWDAYQEEAPDPLPKPLPVQRTPVRSINTQYIEVPEDTFAVVQEAFWEDEQVPVMMVLLSSTPIDNGCDCSERDYLDVTQPSPTHGRLDRYDATGREASSFPNGELVAARGFLSWDETSAANRFAFVIMTSLFHNHVPDEGWTFETKDQFPVG